MYKMRTLSCGEQFWMTTIISTGDDSPFIKSHKWNTLSAFEALDGQ